MANQKRRKKQIIMLESTDGPVSDPKGILDVVFKCYKHLFDYQDKLDINLKDDFWIMVVRSLRILFLAHIYAEGTPSPDGFYFLFINSFETLLKVTSWPY